MGPAFSSLRKLMIQLSNQWQGDSLDTGGDGYTGQHFGADWCIRTRWVGTEIGWEPPPLLTFREFARLDDIIPAASGQKAPQFEYQKGTKSVPNEPRNGIL